MIGPHDLWLAAACIAHDHTLATGNIGELSRVPGLRVKRWPASTGSADREASGTS